MKLTKQQKQLRKMWLNELYERGGDILHQEGDFSESGLTLVGIPSVSGKNSRFVDVAISIKQPDEKYRRKTGEFLALERLMNGQFITVPRDGDIYNTLNRLEHGIMY